MLFSTDWSASLLRLFHFRWRLPIIPLVLPISTTSESFSEMDFCKRAASNIFASRLYMTDMKKRVLAVPLVILNVAEFAASIELSSLSSRKAHSCLKVCFCDTAVALGHMFKKKTCNKSDKLFDLRLPHTFLQGIDCHFGRLFRHIFVNLSSSLSYFNAGS